jgi:hypothetical protein
LDSFDGSSLRSNFYGKLPQSHSFPSPPSLMFPERQSVRQEPAAMWTERHDWKDNLRKGEWKVFTAKDTLAEEKTVRPQGRKLIPPHWSDGVPTKFCKQVYCPAFYQGRVHHEAIKKLTSLELTWENSYTLSHLRKNDHLLPRNYTSEWSGVYRIFSPNTTIHRCCGSDPTGTLYLGLACSRGRNWSILRTRIHQVVYQRHHVIENWNRNKALTQRYTWDSLAVQWAFTNRERLYYKGEAVAEAIMAEHWLLACYNDSFGKYPPWNQKG